MTLKAIATESLSASGITIGTSVITGGTDTRVLFDDAGVVGESAGLTYTKASGTLAATALVGITPLTVFHDAFVRTTSAGSLGIATTGQSYILTGAGAATAQVTPSGTWQGSAAGDTYAGVLLPNKPSKFSQTFTIISGTSGVTFHISADATVSLTNMVHMITSTTGFTLTWWQGATQNQPFATPSGSSTWTTPISVGSSVTVSLTLSGNTVTVTGPSGETFVNSDPHVSAVTGGLVVSQQGNNNMKVTDIAVTAPILPSPALVLTGSLNSPFSTTVIAPAANSGPIYFPTVASGYDTLATLGLNQSFTGLNVFAGPTVTTANNFLKITGTWNNAGVAFGAALLVNITNTASTASGTNLIDLQVGGSSKFSIRAFDGFTTWPNVSVNPGSGNVTALSFATGGGGSVTIANAIMTNPGSSNGVLQRGAADAAVAVAQTERVQSVVAGTAAANGANWTFIGSLPTGTGTSGDIIIQTGVKTGSGTTQGTATTALTIKGETQAITIAAGKSLVLGNSASTGLAAGVLAALTNASLVITDASGQAYRIPCII